MVERKAIDWEKVEAQYRAGKMSLREIASEHGIAESYIRQRAKGNDKRAPWDRDLTAKVRAKADSIVRNELVRSDVRTESPSEKEVVEIEAKVEARIRLEHRSDIGRLRALVGLQMRECEVETGDIDLFERLGEMMRSPDKSGADKLNDIYRKVISLPQRVDSVKKLAETLKILIALEREAYNMASSADDMAKKIGEGAAMSALDAYTRMCEGA